MSLGGDLGYHLAVAFSDRVVVLDLTAGTQTWAASGSFFSASFIPGFPWILTTSNTAGQVRFYDIRTPPGQYIAMLEFPSFTGAGTLKERDKYMNDLRKTAAKRTTRLARTLNSGASLSSSMSLLIAASEVCYDMLGSELREIERDQLCGSRLHTRYTAGAPRPLSIGFEPHLVPQLPRRFRYDY